MANNFSNVMDGSRLSEQNIYTCRLCLKQFMYYSDLAIHERMHFDQMSLSGSLQSGLRPGYDNHVVPAYSSASSTPGTLDSFDKLIQPFRSSMSETDIRSQTDSRNMVPSSQADLRNYVPSSPADHRNMAVTSPADLRNMVASSPGDPRNMVPSSPADPRNLIPSSPADTRNMIPSSPADPRNMFPASPVDPRNLVPASPVDPRSVVPASPVDPRNMVPASPVDPRNMVPASPVDPRNLVPASPAAQQDPRNLMVSSPASQPDKSTQQLYRGEMEAQQSMNLGSRSTPINTQSPTISMATVPMSTDVRLLPVETRPLPSQVTDSRHLSADSHSLTYSSASFLDSLTRSFYSQDLTNKPMSVPAFSGHPVGRPEEMLGLDSRQHPIQKPDPYYGIHKSMYITAGSEVGDTYTSNQYGLNKLLSPQQGTYFQQPASSQPQVHYGIDKLTATPLNYYTQPNNTDKSSIEPRDTVPKQTLHYGPSVQPVSTPNHSHYQQSIPRSEQQHLSNPSQHKVPNSSEQLQVYHSGSASPHLTYSQVYKGSQPQTQVYAPVPSHALPSQHDYKLSTEPIPTVNLEPTPQPQKITCYICHAPFSNMGEMSEHLKIHAQGMVSQNPVSPQPSQQQQQQQVAARTGGTVQLKQGAESIQMHVTEKKTSQDVSAVNTVIGKEKYFAKTKYDVPEKPRNVTPPKVKETVPVSCSVCGKAFLKQAFLIEHMKLHTSPQQYECKVCGKVFKKKSKCTRHEALHSRDIHLYYCEICDKNFEQKGKYLYHIQNQHTEQDSVHIHQHREHQVGTKKAVPLTGGSIDTTFDGVDIEKYIDCQICDEEIEKVNLVSHLKTHDVHTCDKCDQVFLHKTECVEHLMSQHRKELDDAKSEDEHESPKKKFPVKTETKKVEEAEKSMDVKSEVSGTTPKVNRSRKDVIKDLKEKKKEVMKNLKEKQKELRDLENQKKMKDKKPKIDVDKSEDIKLKEDVKKSKISNSTESNVSEVKMKFSCSKCEKSFAKNSDLITHVESHVRDPTRIYCEVCDYSYHMKEKGYYIYHMKYHRDHELSDSRQPAHLPCKICFASIPKENFVTHVKRTHSLYSCDICQWSYSTEKSLVKHMRSIHGGKKYKYYVYDESHYIEDIVEPEPSSEPPVVYKKLKDIKAEQQTAEKKKPAKIWTCQECNRTFTKKQNHERHLKSHNITMEWPHIDCEICHATLDSRGTYIYHLQQHTELDNTTSAGVKLEISEEKIEPSEKNNEHFKSELGITGTTGSEGNEGNGENSDKMNAKSENKDEKSTAVDKEQVQMETEQTEKPVVKQTLITVLNPETGDFEEKLVEEKDEPDIMIDIKIFEEDYDKENEDVKSEDMDAQEEKKSIKDVVNEIVYCRLCNKCVKRNTLSEHARTHMTYNCHTCQYAFTKKQRYVDHQRALHLSDYIAEEIEKFKQFEHPLSEESIHNESNTEQKEKDSHRRKRSTKMLNCPLCTSELKQNKYVEHLRSHDKVVLRCQFCEHTFSKKSYLTIHEKSHEFISLSKNKLPFLKLCPVCENSMKSRKKFVRHIAEHLKKAVVKCKQCNVIFTSERTLDNHTKIMHDPHAKVYWKQDGEGLKFDTKTGRIHDVLSDFICEIKELNELCKQYGKPAIWVSPPVKSKEKTVTNVSKVKEDNEKHVEKAAEVSESVETSESDDKVKSETSDEDYIPVRNLRKRRSRKGSSTDTDEQDEDEAEKDQEYVPSKKKRGSSRYTSDSTSEENYKPKSTKTRTRGVKKDLLKQKIKRLKQVAGRVLRSTLEKNTEKKSEKVNAKKSSMKRKSETEERSSSPKKKRSELENLSFEEVHKERDNSEFPEKCPECGIAQFSLSSYKEHARLHTGNMPFECPVCEKSFTRLCNMNTHLKHRHPEYKPKNLRRREKKGNQKTESPEMVRKLRNRDRSPDSKPGTPVSSSTPVKGSRLVVKLSPIDVEEKKKSVKTPAVKGKDSAKKSNNAKLLASIEKKSVYQCEVCKRKLNTRWNYAQHIQGHKKDGKKKEKENKTVGNKKEMKKKEKESKPFSCKDCSESFKKKRDLYIHTKIHSTDEDEVIDKVDNVNDSINTAADNSTAEKGNDSSVDMNASNRENGKMNESKSESNNSSFIESLETSTDLNLGNSVSVDTESNKLVNNKKKQMAKDEDIDRNGCKDSQSPKTPKTVTGSVSDHVVNSSSSSSKEKPVKTGTELNTKPTVVDSNGCEVVKDVSVPQNNNDDHSRSGDSDSEKAKLLRQPSVNKMSAETAVSKWKAKVTELLSSQLDLHAARQQEELANPEIKRVKEYLSVSGKVEKFKFECRICGDSNCDQESTFRTHMDVHLNEPPPHCSICDIYFMAIHPKRRLVEHNKKKHPELNC